MDQSATSEAEFALRQALLEPRTRREWTETHSVPDGSDERRSAENCSVDDLLDIVIAGNNPFKSAAVSPTGRLVALGDVHGLLRIVEAENCTEKIRNGYVTLIQSHGHQINSIAFSTEGELLLTSSEDKTAAVWTTRGRLLSRLRGHRERILTSAFVPEDGRTDGPAHQQQILTGSPSQSRLWSVDLPRGLRGDGSKAHNIRLNHDGSRLVTAGARKARLLVTTTGDEIVSFDQGDHVSTAVLSSDGSQLAIAGNGKIWARDLKNQSIQQFIELKEPEGRVRQLAFSSDGASLLSISSGIARLWDWRTKLETNSFRHEDITSAVFSNHGRIVTTGRDCTAKIWSLDSAEPITELWHPDIVHGATFDHSGQGIVTACKDGTVRLWRHTGKLAAELPISDEALYGASIGPDGSSFVVWGRAEEAYLWRPEEGNRAVVLAGHDSDLGAPKLSDDGRLVLTFDQTRARIWDAASPNDSMLLELTLDAGGAASRPKVNAVSWSDDGLRLAVAWDDGRIELHDCEACRPLDQVVEMARHRLSERRPERTFTPEERRRYLH